MEVQGMSVPVVAMIIVLAVCFAALLGLVVTLPAVTNFFRRAQHAGPVIARPTTI